MLIHQLVHMYKIRFKQQVILNRLCKFCLHFSEYPLILHKITFDVLLNACADISDKIIEKRIFDKF